MKLFTEMIDTWITISRSRHQMPDVLFPVKAYSVFFHVCTRKYSTPTQTIKNVQNAMTMLRASFYNTARLFGAAVDESVAVFLMVIGVGGCGAEQPALNIFLNLIYCPYWRAKPADDTRFSVCKLNLQTHFIADG
jgi:hypothetical protein